MESPNPKCEAQDIHITSSMEYACAAILEKAGFINFTPNIVSVPAILQLANENHVPLAGRDGKTGQTLLKTSIAPLFVLRALHVNGWYSTNILGNSDGMSLAQPDACDTKVKSKEQCLENILGYPVDDHQVHIHFYKPRKDNKESWDNIDFEGFLGYPMQLKLNLLARDSVLAAPLILDLCRLLQVSMQRGEKGPQGHLSLFFKTPEIPIGETVVQDLFAQRELFQNWVQNCVKKCG